MVNIIDRLHRYFLLQGLEKHCRKLGSTLTAGHQHAQAAQENANYAGDAGKRFRVYADQGQLSESSRHWKSRSQYLQKADSELAQARRNLSQSVAGYNQLAVKLHKLDRLCGRSHPQYNQVVLAAMYLRSASSKFPKLESRLRQAQELLEQLKNEAPDIATPDLTEPLLNEVLTEIASQKALRDQSRQEAQKLRKRGGFFSMFRRGK